MDSCEVVDATCLSLSSRSVDNAKHPGRHRLLGRMPPPYTTRRRRRHRKADHHPGP